MSSSSETTNPPYCCKIKQNLFLQLHVASSFLPFFFLPLFFLFHCFCVIFRTFYFMVAKRADAGAEHQRRGVSTRATEQEEWNINWCQGKLFLLLSDIGSHMKFFSGGRWRLDYTLNMNEWNENGKEIFAWKYRFHSLVSFRVCAFFSSSHKM